MLFSKEIETEEKDGITLWGTVALTAGETAELIKESLNQPHIPKPRIEVVSPWAYKYLKEIIEMKPILNPEEAGYKKYIGTKLIWGKPMTRQEYVYYRGWTLPEDEDGTDAGYLVIYADGYESWSPTPQFEEAYRKTTGINFGLAIEAAKKGMKIARSGWNGKGMFVIVMPGYMDGVPCNENHAKAYGLEVGTIVKIRPHMQLKTADGSIAEWSPSGSDALADDWYIVE